MRSYEGVLLVHLGMEDDEHCVVVDNVVSIISRNVVDLILGIHLVLDLNLSVRDLVVYQDKDSGVLRQDLSNVVHGVSKDVFSIGRGI